MFSVEIVQNLLELVVMISRFLPPKYHAKSYAQEGEDLMLARYFESKTGGFYIDVGAHHPQRFSNTYYFYNRGWRGINIDATPNSMDLFKKVRPKDINILAAISDKNGHMQFYEFNEPALNTLSKEVAESRENLGYKIIRETRIETLPLKDVLDKNISPNQKIDFMSIDIEGEDLNALKSNDWSKYRPEIILVEILSPKEDYTFVANSDVEQYLKTQNYSFFAKSMNTYFFKRDS